MIFQIFYSDLFFKALSERSSNFDEDPMLDNTGIFQNEMPETNLLI
jgi:hypothetical protein